MIDLDLAKVRERHLKIDSPLAAPRSKCMKCRVLWPCDAIALAKRVAELNARIAAMEDDEMCVCGDRVGSHGPSSEHSPVSMRVYSFSKLSEECDSLRAQLATTRARVELAEANAQDFARSVNELGDERDSLSQELTTTRARTVELEELARAFIVAVGIPAKEEWLSEVAYHAAMDAYNALCAALTPGERLTGEE